MQLQRLLLTCLLTGLLSHSLSGCVREIDEVQHSSSCGECNESEYLMEDLKALLLVVKHFEEVSATSSATASTSTAASSRARRSATTSNVDSTTNRNKRSTTTPLPASLPRKVNGALPLRPPTNLARVRATPPTHPPAAKPRPGYGAHVRAYTAHDRKSMQTHTRAHIRRSFWKPVCRLQKRLRQRTTLT